MRANPDRPNHPLNDLKAVLFDLDGTLVDSAPDLVAALEHVRTSLGLSPCPDADLRHHASRGAAGLLEAGLPVSHHPVIESLKPRFLSHYAANLWVQSRPFEGIDRLLDQLRRRGLALGIVTNKIERLTAPLVRQAGWHDHFGCLVCGDSVTAPKPDPEPVLAACRGLGIDPGQALFIGDDQRDVESGRSAGTLTAIAQWGYIDPEAEPGDWGANLAFATPEAVIDWLVKREHQDN